jgi:ABC-2 type transport system ATP-binding protein
VLHEVESMAERVIVVVRGRLAAAGGRHAIRDAMDDVPRQVLVRAAEPRRLAASLVGLEAVAGLSLEGGDLVISTTRARDLAVALPRTARDLGIRITEVRPLDDSLESLFRELVK